MKIKKYEARKAIQSGIPYVCFLPMSIKASIVVYKPAL